MNIQETSLFLGLYIATLAILGFAGYFFYADYVMQAKVQKQVRVSSERFQSDMTYIDLPRISVTINSMRADRAGNVRMDISLEVEKQYAALVQNNSSRIADRLVSYTQSLNYDEIARPKSTEWLKPDLLQEVNSASATAPVKDLIFRQMVVY